jgi:hypothetical protein
VVDDDQFDAAKAKVSPVADVQRIGCFYNLGEQPVLVPLS